jgi:hypothetical protein
VQLVILAAGHGRRFGGLKQLAPVGPNGEALLDYTARDAVSCGVSGVVIVVRSEIRSDILDHVKLAWPGELPFEIVNQEGVAGTAQAVASAGPLLDGPFGIVNADDLYGTDALALLAEALGGAAGAAGGTGGPGEQVLVGYRLDQTAFSGEAVTRGVCRVAEDRSLEGIVEQRVQRVSPPGAAETLFSAVPVSRTGAAGDSGEQGEQRTISGASIVSMNLWGFLPRMLGHLEEAIESFDPPPQPPDAKPPELLLPDVVGRLVASGTEVFKVFPTSGRCIGITHPEDLEAVRAELAGR